MSAVITNPWKMSLRTTPIGTSTREWAWAGAGKNWGKNKKPLSQADVLLYNKKATPKGSWLSGSPLRFLEQCGPGTPLGNVSFAGQHYPTLPSHWPMALICVCRC